MHGNAFVVSPSTIITQPTDTIAAAPFSGVFTCSVEGYGYQNITWYKQSGTLPYKHKTNTVTSQGVATGTLIIPNVTEVKKMLGNITAKCGQMI